MDCVLTAYNQHLGYLGYSNNNWDTLIYEKIKSTTHKSRKMYTYGGVVPFMLRSMASTHGLTIDIEHTIWTKNHYLAYANNEGMSVITKAICLAGNFGEFVTKITEKPAIYLMWSSDHAVFSTEVPNGVPVMAIKLIDISKRREKYDRKLNQY